jgi:hypothetical protein
MRSPARFFTDIIRKSPFMFPWVALFHVLMLGYILWLYHAEPLSLVWLQPAWMLAYTACWLFVCDLRKWAGYSYLALTSLNLALNYFIQDQAEKDIYVSALLLIDVGFSFFVLFYFRRFE